MSKLILTAPVVALATAAAPAAAQTYEWTGFYVGAHGALADPDADWDGESIYQTVDGAEGSFTTASQTATIDESLSSSEFGGGGRIGFNWQAGALVFGVEADATLFDFDDAVTRTSGGTTYTLRSETSDLETIRARVGVAFGSAMLFATGGAAFSGIEHSLVATNVSEVVIDGGEGGGGAMRKATSLAIRRPGPLGGTGGGGDTIGTVTANLADTAESGTGWTIGGGGEVRLGPNITLAGTLLYVDFGSEDLADSDGPASIAATVDTTMVVGMLGINFSF